MSTTTSPTIIRFLQRDGALRTFVYERRVILTVESLCLLAGVIVAPSRQSMLLLAITAPLALWGAELTRADRSAAARKAEQAAELGLPAIELACSKDIEQMAKNRQIMTAAAPIVALAMSFAGAGASWRTALPGIVVGFIVSVVRYGMVEAYGSWRKWYRSHVPVMLDMRVDTYAGLGGLAHRALNFATYDVATLRAVQQDGTVTITVRINDEARAVFNASNERADMERCVAATYEAT